MEEAPQACASWLSAGGLGTPGRSRESPDGPPDRLWGVGFSSWPRLRDDVSELRTSLVLLLGIPVLEKEVCVRVNSHLLVTKHPWGPVRGTLPSQRLGGVITCRHRPGHAQEHGARSVMCDKPACFWPHCVCVAGTAPPHGPRTPNSRTRAPGSERGACTRVLTASVRSDTAPHHHCSNQARMAREPQPGAGPSSGRHAHGRPPSPRARD